MTLVLITPLHLEGLAQEHLPFTERVVRGSTAMYRLYSVLHSETFESMQVNDAFGDVVVEQRSFTTDQEAVDFVKTDDARRRERTCLPN